jgi:hypothetical protein
MMEFEEVTPFRLVRSLGVSGTRNPAIYLLICDGPSVLEIEQDLSTETEVQLGTVIRISTASEVLRDGLPAWDDGSTRLIYFDRWLPKLVAAMDRHSALLVQDGGQILMLADKICGTALRRRAEPPKPVGGRLPDHPRQIPWSPTGLRFEADL